MFIYGTSVACTVGCTWLMYSLCMAHTIKNPHEYKGPRLKTLGREDQQIIKCRPWIVRSAARMAECRASRKAVRRAYRSASHRALT